MGTGSSSEGVTEPKFRDVREPNGVEKVGALFSYHKQRNAAGDVTRKVASLNAEVVIRLGGQNFPINLAFQESFEGGATVGDMVTQLMKNKAFQRNVMNNFYRNQPIIDQIKTVKLTGPGGQQTTIGEAWDELYENYSSLLDMSHLKVQEEPRIAGRNRGY